MVLVIHKGQVVMIRAGLIIGIILFSLLFLVWNTTKNNYEVISAEIKSALTDGK